MKKKFITILIVIVFGVLIIKTPLYYPLRSYAFMFPYSMMQHGKSLLVQHDVKFKIPGGLSTKEKDWYPFVMTFNDDSGFSNFTGKDYSLTILYNFGAFEMREGSSSFYNPNSPYFCSFYGGYVIRNNQDPTAKFGFAADGQIDITAVTSVPKYDQTRLVLPSLGCPANEAIFEGKVDSIQYDVPYIGYDSWVKIDSTITTNSPIHWYKEDHNGYIQYGKPIAKYYQGKDFPLTTLKGRVYVRYFEDYGMTFFLYVLAPDMQTIEACDRKILSRSRI